MALTKADLAEACWDTRIQQAGCQRRKRLKCFSEVRRKALENGEQVKLSGFGNFDLREKNERPGQ